MLKRFFENIMWDEVILKILIGVLILLAIILVVTFVFALLSDLKVIDGDKIIIKLFGQEKYNEMKNSASERNEKKMIIL